MPRTLQFKRYGSATLANTIGANGELIINQTNKTLTVHDGVTPGGFVVSANTIPNADSFARGTANSATTLAQSAYNYANTLLTTSVDSFARNTANGANTLAQTARDTANGATNLAQSAYNYANTIINGIDQTARNTANGAVTLAQSAYNYANTVGVNATGVDQFARNTANTSNNLAQSAYDSSNTKFSSSGGTITGNVIITGVMNVSSNIIASNISAPLINTSALLCDTTDAKSIAIETFHPNFNYGLNYAVRLSASQVTASLAFGAVNNWLRVGGIVGTFDSTHIVIAPDFGFTLGIGGVIDNSVGLIPAAPTFIRNSYISDMHSSNVYTSIVRPYFGDSVYIHAGTSGGFKGNIILGETSTNMVKVGEANTVDLSVTGNISSLGVSANTITANNFKISGSAIGTTDGEDGWGGYDLILSPNGEGSAYIIIPKDAGVANGALIQINNYSEFGGGVQLGADSNNWIFDSNGAITLPKGSVINETSNTTIISPPGAGAGQSLVIRPTATGHIHLTAGDPANTDIYLGDDDQYVKIEKNGGDVVIGTDSNTNHWTFGTNGGLTLPGDYYIGSGEGSLIVSSPSTLAIVANTGINSVSWFFDTDGTLSLPGTLQFSAVDKTGGDANTSTALDLTKAINKLTNGEYTLANGIEGQIMYLVRQTGSTAHTVTVANARLDGSMLTDIPFTPFTDGTDPTNMAMLIFTDGAWQSMGGFWNLT